MLCQMRPLLRLGPVITLVPSTPVRLVRWKWKCRNDGKVFFFYARDDTVNVVLKKGAYGL